MKIGIVTDFYYPWIGGPAALIRALGQGLSLRSHQIELLAPSPSGEPCREHEGSVRITRAATVASPVGHNLRMCVRPIRAARRWLDDVQPDVLHVHHPFPLSAAVILEARRRRIPVIATNHTIPACSLWGIRRFTALHRTLEWAFGSWIVWLLGKCQSVITPTATAADLLRQLGFTGAIEVISNGIDFDRFRAGRRNSALRQRLMLDSRPVVLYTGRLDAEKQMDVWLRAAAHLRQSYDAQFIVGGEGGDRSRLEQLARDLDLTPSTRFIGYLPSNDLPDLYALADVYFITSPVELQSISTLEALAAGLPVVGVRSGALPELILHGENGYCAAPGDAKGLAHHLLEILQDAAGQCRMRECSSNVAAGHQLEA
ncbi:MAG: glycosyltransferase, partial [Chloroflexota bacterium]